MEVRTLIHLPKGWMEVILKTQIRIFRGLLYARSTDWMGSLILESFAINGNIH